MMINFRRVLIIVAVGICSQFAVNAQSATVTLRVTVVDSNDAAVAAASVEVTNLRTKSRREVSTSGDGLALLPQLAPGHYLITVRKQGFQSAEVTNVALNVNDWYVETAFSTLEAMSTFRRRLMPTPKELSA